MRTLLLCLGISLAAMALIDARDAAQVLVVNPKVAVFTASPNQADVTNYVMEVSRQADPTTVVRTTDLGKPTPAGNGDITVALVKTGLVNNVNYIYNIVTNSPGGSTRSVSPSNPFVWVDPAAPASNLRAQ